jgi:hypothetical protein
MPIVVSGGHKKTPTGSGRGPYSLAPLSQNMACPEACLLGAPFPGIQLDPPTCPVVQQALDAQRGLFITAALAAAVRSLAEQRQLTPAQLLGHWQPEAC